MFFVGSDIWPVYLKKYRFFVKSYTLKSFLQQMSRMQQKATAKVLENSLFIEIYIEIIILVDERRVTVKICPQSREAEIPTLLKVTSGVSALPVEGNTG